MDKEWIIGRIKKEWDKMLKYLYNNGSVPYKKFRGIFAFNLGLSIETADKWLQVLFDSELIERKMDEVVLTKEGFEYISKKVVKELGMKVKGSEGS